MKEFFADNHAHYPMVYRGKEYAFYIKRSGVGHCQCRTDASKAITREDKYLATRAFFGDPKARNRVFGVEEEFTVEVKLSKKIAALIWEGWDEIDLEDENTATSTPENHAREAKLDKLLAPIVRKLFEL